MVKSSSYIHRSKEKNNCIYKDMGENTSYIQKVSRFKKATYFSICSEEDLL